MKVLDLKRRKSFAGAILVATFLWCHLQSSDGFLWAQSQSATQQLLAYPDVIFHGGKVVIVDDGTTSTDPGTIVEGLAVRGDRILAIGSTREILALRGPDTHVIDLRGRTMLPGIIDTHSHLFDYAMRRYGWRDLLKIQTVIEAEPGDSWERIAKRVLDTLRREVPERRPGEWISVVMPRESIGKAGKLINAEQAALQGLIHRDQLDEVAPNNPVHIRVATSALTNSKAQELIRKFWYGPEEPDLLREDGFSSNTINRNVASDFLIPDIRKLAEIYRQENWDWARYGVTTWASSVRSIQVLAAYMLLDHQGEIGIRLGYGPSMGTPLQVIPTMHGIDGYGTDYVWQIGSSMKGMDSIYPGVLTTKEPPEISQEVKDMELAYVSKRLTDFAKFIEDTVAAGQRFSNTHTAGDRTLDISLDAIEKGSARAGLSPQEIRAKRHSIDHCQMNPRPDQIPRIKRLGIMMSCGSRFIEGSPEVLRDYGEEVLDWIVPVNSLISGGAKTVFEIDDSNIATYGTAFHYLGLLVTRKTRNGTVYGGRQRIDRVWALKMATIWASEYVLREDVLGTLEPEKFADLLVLDKDYLTVPELEIGSIKPLLTMVGGKIVFQDDTF